MVLKVLSARMVQMGLVLKKKKKQIPEFQTQSQASLQALMIESHHVPRVKYNNYLSRTYELFTHD